MGHRIHRLAHAADPEKLDGGKEGQRVTLGGVKEADFGALTDLIDDGSGGILNALQTWLERQFVARVLEVIEATLGGEVTDIRDEGSILMFVKHMNLITLRSEPPQEEAWHVVLNFRHRGLELKVNWLVS
jgi:hypothetical protein